MDNQHQVGRALAHGHADALHLLRQPRQRDRDPVLNKHLCLIDVRSRLEHDVDRNRAVAGRLRHHVDHVVDAVDLLLDRRRHGLRDHLGRGTGKSRIHDDRGRRNVGIFGDRQRAKGDRADERQEDRNDAGKYRPIDEEVRESHGPFLHLMDFGRRFPAGRSLRDGFDLAVFRRHLLPRTGALQAVDDNAVGGREAGANDPQAVHHGAELDAFDADGAVIGNREDDFAGLIGGDRAVGHQQRVVSPPKSRSLPKYPGVSRPSLFSKMARPRMVPVRGLRTLSTKSIRP